MCDAPCSLSLLTGRYELGVAAGGGQPLRAGVIEIDRPGVLHISYSDMSAWRVLGWITWPLGLVVGGILMGYIAVENQDVTTAMVSGLATWAAGGILGGAMIAAGDGATIHFE